MNENDLSKDKYESIKSKLRKLHALVMGGTPGEARNAQFLLDKLCAEYGITLDEILDQESKKWYEFHVGGKKINLKLFFQCYYKITNSNEISYRQGSGEKARLRVELTAYEYAEIKSLFEWHKANFQKDLDNMLKALFDAYCLKHTLHSERTQSDDEEDLHLTEEDIRRIMAMQAMRDNLNNNTYHKLIERR